VLQNARVNERNPQAREMADESMVRNLAAQAEAIWPQEEPLVRRHAPHDVLDVGCGTGEFSSRVAALFPRASVTGVDLLESHLELARQRYRGFGDRLRFQQADAFELPFEKGSFDLVACRHMLQAVPEPERVLAEMVRVTRPGGVVHLIPEDYEMIFAAPARLDIASFWTQGPRRYGAATGIDLFIGRHIYHHLRALPVDGIDIQYVHVDTQRVPRETFARIFTAWRDGYSETIAPHLGWSVEKVRDHFDATIECILNPDGYALWLVPVVSCRVR
jgi:ubiquinone/menaquinone biosynthesis C-methylase UbiE